MEESYLELCVALFFLFFQQAWKCVAKIGSQGAKQSNEQSVWVKIISQ